MKKINLFNIPNHKINTNNFSHLLHDNIVNEFEKNFCEYVGAQYACSVNSATNAIFLCLLNKGIEVDVPSIIPPVVCNAILTSGNTINFVDNTEWVGDSYILHDFGDYKIIDSAQKVEKNQFKKEANDQDLMIYSFYPTKPIGSCDGGIIVSNDEKKIKWFKEATLNGMTFSNDNWSRKIKFPGYKMYMNTIQAYIANENLKNLPFKNKKLKKLRKKYNKSFGLQNTSGHLYRINVNNRKEFIENLEKINIQTGIHYSALHMNKVYCKEKIYLPNSEFQNKTTVSLCYNELITDKESDIVIEAVKSYADRC